MIKKIMGARNVLQRTRAYAVSVAGSIFHAIRPYTPRVKNTYNDVCVERYHLIDKLHPNRRTTDRPLYEDTLVAETKQRVSSGDTVVILGGGLGVTTVHAAREAGPAGEVYV